MKQELTLDQVLSDPLIAQVRRADGLSAPEFARLLLNASDAYRASEIVRLHSRRADLFYSTIGAGELQFQKPEPVPAWKIEGRVSDW